MKEKMITLILMIFGIMAILEIILNFASKVLIVKTLLKM